MPNNEVPDLATYSTGFEGENIATLEATNLDEEITNYDDEIIERITLTPHLWLCYRKISDDVLHFLWNSADSQNFPHQLAKILDDALRGTFTTERIAFALNKDNSPKYYEKTDNLKERETTIKQEVAV